MPSPDNTYVVGIGATVIDARGSVYAINSAGRITINGKVDPTTAGVDALGYANGLVWQKNADNHWYSKTSAAARWASYAEINGVPPMAVPSASSSGIFVTPGVGSVQDTNGNSWAINVGGVVVVDGKADLTTGRVIQLDFVNGVLWQENADGNWYSKVKPSDTWTQATRTDPIVAAQASTLTWTGDRTNPSRAAAWRLPNGAHAVPMAHEALTMSEGTMNLGSGHLAGDVLRTFPTAAINPTINMTNGGSLKLDAGGAGGVGATTVHVTGGTAALNVTGFYSSIVVTADTISSVILNADMEFRGSLTETGGTVVVNGASHFIGSTVRLTSNLAGNGLLAVNGARDSFGTLEVDGAIGSGVTLAATGTDAAILLDQPTLDQGTITLSYARLELKGEAEADSVSYKDSLVSLYQGDTLLSSLKVIGLPGQGYTPNSANDGTLHFGKSAGGSVFAYNDSPSDFIPDLSTTTTPQPQHV